ncbi:hypothetical protein G7Y89_g12007 [Cudoniella acicularis]|uniref:Peptidase A1 domain-containing protein n=1 Tax=Cudoniella acicularis TaxID=354080 RepID=A0A8H4VXG3_9HELO|nr:hypothetical protein G7Y89_g12007 [Cudoniella acicularis]
MFSRKVLLAFMVLQLLGLPRGLQAAITHTNKIRAPTASPLVVPPSGQWDGSDGPWSSFTLSIGTPPQSARVLASTTSNQPWVVLPLGCLPADPTNCANIRGGAFQPNASTSWIKNNQTSNGVFTVAIESNLGLTADASYGYDNISLSTPGTSMPSLSNQILGGIESKNFSMGLFGLNPAATSFSGNSDPTPSYISSLKTQNFIPSLSYAYTAGAPYRLPKVLGSLTLGGYDASLFEPNQLTTSFGPNSSSDLTISVNQIQMATNSGKTSLSTTPFSAFIDSTVAYLYLPLQVCQQFETAFGISYDPKTDLYLVNDTLHTQLLSQNANVTFTLTNATANTLVDIVLPYQAFDLTASWPLVQNTSRYFPLKRAANNNQITLGRTFLQEAYLIADYERSTFTISQRKWSSDTQSNIQSILPPTVTSAPQVVAQSGVNVAVIVAAVVGGFVIISIIVGTFLILHMRKKKHEKLAKASVSSETPFRKSSAWEARSAGTIGGTPAPSSVHMFDPPPPRPASLSSFYQSEYDVTETEEARASEFVSAPVNFGRLASEAIHYQSGFNVSEMSLRSPELEAHFTPVLPFQPSPVQSAGEFVCELPARENVGEQKFSKKPEWI